MSQPQQGVWPAEWDVGVDGDTQVIPAVELAAAGAGGSGGADGAELARRLAELRGSPTGGSAAQEEASSPSDNAAGTNGEGWPVQQRGTQPGGQGWHQASTPPAQPSSPQQAAAPASPPPAPAPAPAPAAPQAPGPGASGPEPQVLPAQPASAPAEREGRPGVRQTSVPFGKVPSAAISESSAEPKPPGRIPTERMLLGSPETAPDSPGWRFIYRLTGRKVNRESKAMQLLHEMQDRIGQSLRSGPYVIATGGYKGGCGKTTEAMNLGVSLAKYRTDKILVFDANSDVGTLPSRTAASCPVSVREVARAARDGGIQNSGQMTSMVGRDESRLDVIGADEDPTSVQEFTEAELDDVLTVARRFYDVILIDTGINQTHPVTRAVMRRADALVLATGAAVDEANLISQALNGLWANHHDLVARTVLAIKEPPKPAVDVSVIEKHFSQAGVPAVRIPQDPHLATGGAVVWGQLAAPTRTAVTGLAAEVVDKLAGVNR